jgi:GxxExxY protein
LHRKGEKKEGFAPQRREERKEEERKRRERGLTVVCEVPQPVKYEDIQIEAGYRLDMLVEDVIVIENKAVERVLPIHIAQLLTYLKLSDRRLGYLMNWNVSLVKDGIYRRVNKL